MATPEEERALEAQRRANEPDMTGQADTDGRDEDNLDPGVQRGGADTQPEAASRGTRDTAAMSPADAREEVTRRMREKRTQARADFEAGDTGVDAPDAGAADEPEGERRAEQPGEVRRLKIRVNHQDLELPEDEIIRRAQLGTASEDAFAEARRLQQEARETLADARRAAQDMRGRPDSAHQAEAVDPAVQEDPRTKGLNLRETAEALQNGDTEDAEKALSDLVREIRAEGPAESSDEMADRVENRLQARAAVQRFTAYFADKHPELVGRPGLQLELRDAAHRATLEELQQVIGDRGQTLSANDLARAAQSPALATKWLGDYSQQGVKRRDGQSLPNPIAVMDRAADALKREFGLVKKTAQPVDPGRQQQRVAEKQRLSEPRPAQTGQRQGGQPQARLTPDQRRSGAVAARRQAMGLDRVT